MTANSTLKDLGKTKTFRSKYSTIEDSETELVKIDI